MWLHEGDIGIGNSILNTFLTLHRKTCMRESGEYIVHLTSAKDIYINASLGMFE
jgi:hypothetical protein